MLDDSKYIQQFDSDDALGVIADLPQQLTHKFSVNIDPPEEGIQHVVLAGMGGSGLAARFVQGWWHDELSVPTVLLQDYDVPAWVDEDTLVVCSSYSGDTEETLSAYAQAAERGARRVVMTTGGELARRAREDEVAVYELPAGYQPRMAMWYNLRAMAELFEQLGLIEEAVSRLEASADGLEAAVRQWGPSVPTADNRAKHIAEECLGKPVWVYAGPLLSSAAYKWKISINESSKQVASWNQIPEFNHNELLGWTGQPQQKPFTVIQLQSELEHERIRQRFEVTNRLLSGRMPAPITIPAEGGNRVQQLLWACLLGDYVSVYLGVLNNINPTRVEDIEKFKRELRSIENADSGQHAA